MTSARPTDPLRTLNCYGKYNVLYHAVRIEAVSCKGWKGFRALVFLQADLDTASMSPDSCVVCCAMFYIMKVSGNRPELCCSVAFRKEDRLVEVYHCDRSSQQAAALSISPRLQISLPSS